MVCLSSSRLSRNLVLTAPTATITSTATLYANSPGNFNTACARFVARVRIALHCLRRRSRGPSARDTIAALIGVFTAHVPPCRRNWERFPAQLHPSASIATIRLSSHIVIAKVSRTPEPDSSAAHLRSASSATRPATLSTVLQDVHLWGVPLAVERKLRTFLQPSAVRNSAYVIRPNQTGTVHRETALHPVKQQHLTVKCQNP